MRARETLECRLLPAVEGKFAAGVGQLFHEGRGEDLSAAGFAGDPRSQDDGVSEEAVSVLDRLPGVQADADADRLLGMLGAVRGERLLDRDRAIEGAARARKREEEAVAL